MTKKVGVLLGLTWTALALGSSSAAVGRPADVGIKEFKFAPAALEVSAGTTVRWTNHDEETHTITSTTGAFASRGLSNDETFSQTFTKPGTYQYFCALHPMMRATVVVK